MVSVHMINKKSIRFYNDHKVRAIWSEEENKWYFSATDIIGAINDEQDYVKAGNYWRWLKKKLTSQGIQPVSATHDFKSKPLVNKSKQLVIEKGESKYRA